jgi:hypothetical protein
VAIYSASTWHGSRAQGHSAAAHAAYIAGENLRDERTGIRHDFSRRSGVEHAQTITPDREPCDLQELWNAAELAERNKDGRFKETARVFREWRIALPAELDADGRRAAAEEFATHLVDRYGVAATVAIHAPEKNQDRRNFHAHIQVTTRQFERTESGAVVLGDKATVELKDTDRKKMGLASGRVEIKEIRAEWAKVANKHLAQASVTARIDHRSYREQRVDLTPTTHVGQEAWAMEQQGIRTERGDAWREEKEAQRREVISNPGVVAEKLAAAQIVFDRSDLIEEAERYVSDDEQLEWVAESAEAHSIALPPSFMTTRRGVERAVAMIAAASGYERFSEIRKEVAAVKWGQRFRQASAAKKSGGVQKNSVTEQDLEAARHADPAGYLEAKGFEVKREGRHISVREGGGDNIALVRAVEPGTGYQEAVATWRPPEGCKDFADYHQQQLERQRELEQQRIQELEEERDDDYSPSM